MKSTSFGSHIRALRGERSRKDIATEAGIHPQSLIKLELGTHHPRIATVGRLATALGVEPSALLAVLLRESEGAER